MNIAIVGTGYVGLVSGCCFAEMGMRVCCVDTDTHKIARLRRGEIPIYEPGLEELVATNVAAGRLSFATDLAEVLPQVEVLFIAVGTPSDATGAADLSSVYEVARTVGRHLSRYLLVVTKSTVPVGTTLRVRELIDEELRLRGYEVPFDVASNPEFLKEGTAIQDFMSPDRVVVGVDSERAKEIMARLYRPFLINNFRVLYMDIASSELTKYASNAMLATRISFMNEVANLCEAIGADVTAVRRGMGADKRIGTSFLYAGCGYGGSCFPKDVRALAQTAREQGLQMRIIEQVDRVNRLQKEVPLAKVARHLGSDLSGRRIALWGLAFKPNTDDMREAPSIVTARELLRSGAEVVAYDPVAIERAREVLPPQVKYAGSIYEAAEGADAVVLLTEWKVFRMPDWRRLRELMRGDLIVDGRNIYAPEQLADYGFVYEGIGRTGDRLTESIQFE